jgi:hypothetical protein
MKPCPWCGVQLERHGSLLHHRYYSHEDCSFAGRTILTKETSAWNRRERGRDAALEEAAARCDEIGRDWTNSGNELKAYAADYLAKCIRDLKSERFPA